MLQSFINLFKKSKSNLADQDYECKRFNDAVFVIRQNNPMGTIPIEGINNRAKYLTGYTDEIKGVDFRKILPGEIAQTVNENVEFIPNGKGISSVLQKIPNFKIKDVNGNNIPMQLRIIRGLSTPELTMFQVIMTDASLINALSDRHERLRHDSEYFDQNIKLPSRKMVIDDANMIVAHGRKHDYKSSYILIKLGNPEYTLQKVVSLLDNIKRESDVIGMLSDNVVIMLMPDTPPKNAIYPIKRFKFKLTDDVRSRIRISHGELKENLDGLIKRKK
jgi:hypothetical protein